MPVASRKRQMRIMMLMRGLDMKRRGYEEAMMRHISEPMTVVTMAPSRPVLANSMKSSPASKMDLPSGTSSMLTDVTRAATNMRVQTKTWRPMRKRGRFDPEKRSEQLA